MGDVLMFTSKIFPTILFLEDFIIIVRLLSDSLGSLMVEMHIYILALFLL